MNPREKVMKTASQKRWSALLVFLAAFLSIAWSPYQSDLLRPVCHPQIHPRLQTALQGTAPGEKVDVWVFFTDKGIFDEESLQKALFGVAGRLDEHARVRRLKVRSPQAVVDFADLPLYAPYLQGIRDQGLDIRASSKWLNAVSVRAEVHQVLALTNLAFVSRMQLVAGGRRREFPIQESKAEGLFEEPHRFLDYGASFAQLNQINVPLFHLWLEENSLGAPGASVRICLLDSGFELTHECLGHVDILGQWDFINDDDVVADQAGDPAGQSAHGTTVLSVIAGYSPGQLIGPAYGASFLLAKTEDIADEQPIEEDFWAAGMEWAEGLGADVASSSLGYIDWYEYEDMDGNTAVTTVVADLASSRGVVVVSAAGNEGQSSWGHIIAPADGDLVIAAGAVDTLGIRPGWSSFGPTADGRIKPDVMACGSGTYAASAYSANGYHRGTGTSLSTPLVAGVAALLLQADSTLTPDQVGQVIRRTATRAGHPDIYYGWGIVDADAARRGVVPQEPPVPTVSSYPNPFSESAIILFQVSRSAQARVAIFTLSGEVVRELTKYCDTGTRCEVVWDGCNASGEAVADGVYLYQVIANERILRGKMVRLDRD